MQTFSAQYELLPKACCFRELACACDAPRTLTVLNHGSKLGEGSQPSHQSATACF